jgi:drug/metabolite transporter (DMT)-like permease
VLGFVGAAVIIGGRNFALSYSGIGLALLAGLSWALYCVLRLKWRGATGPLLARGFGIAALLCTGLHFALERTVLPGLSPTLAAATVGIVSTAISNVAWDEGFRKGDSQLLAVMAYATPLFSTLLLALLGLEALTWRLMIGAVAIVGAGVISRTHA